MVRSAHAQESTTKLKKLSLKLAYKIWVASEGLVEEQIEAKDMLNIQR